MPIPFLLAGAAVVAGLFGVSKGVKASSNNSQAMNYISDAKYTYDNAKERMEKQREITSQCLYELGETKINSYANDIGRFVDSFGRFKHVEYDQNAALVENSDFGNGGAERLKEMRQESIGACEMVRNGVASLGAGAVAGVAAYGGAMMFASASTGTAIATLSGAAATNATLAWFGGGSLAAGGLGVAGGTAVLGGIVLGPVLAVGGSIAAAKSEENLAQAKRYYSNACAAAEKMDAVTDIMRGVAKISNNYNDFIKGFSSCFQYVLDGVDAMFAAAKAEQSKRLINKILRFFGRSVKVDYKLLAPDQQKLLYLSFSMADLLSNMLKTPIMDQDNNNRIAPNAERILEEGSTKCNELYSQSVNLLTAGI